MEAIFRCNCFHLLKHILNCAINFEKYFIAEQNSTLDANSWMLHPFTYDSITTKIEDLIDLQSDFGMKALFKETPYTEF